LKSGESLTYVNTRLLASFTALCSVDNVVKSGWPQEAVWRRVCPHTLCSAVTEGNWVVTCRKKMCSRPQLLERNIAYVRTHSFHIHALHLNIQAYTVLKLIYCRFKAKGKASNCRKRVEISAEITNA
jgi:hypothetical protein